MLLAFRTERDKEKGASQGRLPEPEAKQCTNKCQPIQILLCAPRTSVIRMDFLDLTIANAGVTLYLDNLSFAALCTKKS